MLLLFRGVAAKAQIDPFKALVITTNQNFFKKYIEVRERAENSVKYFKQNSGRYNPEDLAMLKANYNQSATMFNNMINNMKKDLLNGKRRKIIVKYPQNYSKEIECDFRRARDFYQQTYATEVKRITNGQFTAIDVGTIKALLSMATGAGNLIKKILGEVKKWQEGVVDQNLVQRFRFKNWDEIN